MTTWPTDLPTYPLLENYSETIESNTIRTEMEQGPDKLRQRTSAVVRKISVSYFLNKEQVDILDKFYLNDLKTGALAFQFVHPRNSADVDCRFVSPPKYQAANGNYYKVNLELEILP